MDRLSAADVLEVAPTAAGPGFRQISLKEREFPKSLGGGQETHIATSGEAVRDAELSIDVGDTVILGPGEAAFTDLIGLAEHDLAQDLYQSGAAADPTSLTPYDLYVYEATMTESDGRRCSAWATLIKVDDGGNARAVRWETLANFIPTEQPGTAPHPARETRAVEQAQAVAAETVAAQSRVRSDWFAQARRDLMNLPLTLTDEITDRDTRLGLRRQLQAQTETRIAELERLTDVQLTAPRLVGRIRVLAAADAFRQDEIDSELVSMRHVRNLLTEDGWVVQDVHTEGRGYDLEARRNNRIRLIEVKGVLGSAASDGIRMTGEEVLIATQHRGDYWLYVVDQCADGVGQFFGAYEDPATLFSSDMVGTAIFRVPGSSLKTAPGANQ